MSEGARNTGKTIIGSLPVVGAIAAGQDPLSPQELLGLNSLKRTGQNLGVIPTPVQGGAAGQGGGAVSEADRNSLLAGRIAEMQKGREADLARGEAFGQKLFGQGSLGRLAEGRADEVGRLIGSRQSQADVAGQRSGDIQDVIARRKAGLEGLSAPELNAFREQSLGNIGQQEQTALRQLRGMQGAQGVRGGAALGQTSQLLGEFQKQRAAGERDIFLRNIAERQAALNALEQSATGAEATEFGRTQTTQGALENAIAGARQEELNRQQFNIGQTQQERFGQLAAQLGMASMGASERAAAAQGLLGEQQLQASKDIAGRGGKK